MSFNHLEIEKKWQKYWEENKTFKTLNNDKLEKKYILDMFPYPSGSGLHVGHPEGYTVTDILSRYFRMQGFDVMHPMGWDAFGLPAEQFAFQTGRDPKEFTYENIATFKRQIKALGFSYDWDRELATCDASFYKNTQWIFTKLYEHNLAELKEVEVNWCEELGTVLANDEIINDNGKMVSERGNYLVTKKPMRQWVLKITEFAQRLLDDLDEVNFSHSLKEMQRNWIGKSVGAIIKFKVKNESFEVFTTRPDTLYGATYAVLAPEHPLALKLVTNNQKQAVNDYINFAKAKSEIERTELNKEKTGVFLGVYAVNPINNKEIPVYISDYVLNSYGTGALMAVPAHDSRDFEFATKFNLEIIKVIDTKEECYSGNGIHINSELINGLNNEEATEKILDFLEENNVGKRFTNYKLRDWLFSRQRYWGEPFPIIHLENGEIIVDKELPVILPIIKNIKHSTTGESPLANCNEWLEVEVNGIKGKRETNTMPQSAASSWYYIAYILQNGKTQLDLSDPSTHEEINKWLPVDLYVGGTEHAVGHLLYARFWHKFLYDLGILKTKEPFLKLVNQGMILGPDGEKMSKRKGNVINPDDIIKSHGADTLRLYEMFMGPIEQAKPWSTTSLDGSRKFLDRIYRLYTTENKFVDHNDGSLDKIYHETIKKVTLDFEKIAFNTAISQMMIFINECYQQKTIYKEYAKNFVLILSTITPHLGEELYQIFADVKTLAYETWPTYDESFLVSSEVEYVIQVNGKLRTKHVMEIDLDTSIVENKVINLVELQQYFENKNIVKVIVIKNKLVNIVVK